MEGCLSWLIVLCLEWIGLFGFFFVMHGCGLEIGGAVKGFDGE